jgi:hypothetical protein
MIMGMDLWPLARRVASSDRSPHWLRAIARAYKRRYVLKNVLRPLGDALDSGAGLHEQAWPAGTPADTLLRWFDETIAAQPQLGALDFNVFSVLQGPEGELAQCIGMGLPLPPGAVMVSWAGTKQAWWAEGRERIAAALPVDHEGLYTVTDSAGTAFQNLRQR